MGRAEAEMQTTGWSEEERNRSKIEDNSGDQSKEKEFAGEAE